MRDTVDQKANVRGVRNLETALTVGALATVFYGTAELLSRQLDHLLACPGRTDDGGCRCTFTHVKNPFEIQPTPETEATETPAQE